MNAKREAAWNNKGRQCVGVLGFFHIQAPCRQAAQIERSTPPAGAAARF